MLLLNITLIAFGFGPGLNPPLDIHLPNKEEIYNECEREQKRKEPWERKKEPKEKEKKRTKMG